MPEQCFVQFSRKGEVCDAELNALWREAYPNHVDGEMTALLMRCATYWVARVEGELVGIVRAVGDGDKHALLLELCLYPCGLYKGKRSVLSSSRI